MVAKAILIGNLGRDPEVKMIGQNKVVTLQIATSKSWRDKESGEKKQKTSWHRVIIWNKSLAEIAEKYYKKGSKIYVEGELEQREWEEDGKKRSIVEVLISAFNGTTFSLEKREAGGGADIPDGGEGDYGELPYGG
jgi:single-strand DNA-binding protein